MTWKPPLRPGVLYGAAFLLAPLGLFLLVAGVILARPFDAVSAVLALVALLLLAAAVLAGRALFGLLTLAYTLDESGLAIRHGGARHLLPLDTIVEVVP